MNLPDNYFRNRSPADIIAKVTTITLANISLLGADELLRIGWLKNPVIENLYTLTSAGVWVCNKDTSGRISVLESNSSNISSFTSWSHNLQALAAPPTVSALTSELVTSATISSYYHRRIAMVNATSNVGGTLDGDVSLVAATGVAYYNVCRIVSISASQIVAAGATFVIQDTTGAIRTIVMPAFVANVPTDVLQNVYLWGAHDNEPIFLDTTSHDLGNATTFTITVEYWWET